MVHNLIQYNFATVVSCVFLAVFILTNHSFVKKEDRLFLLSDLSVFILTFVDSIELITETWAKPTYLRILMSAIGYSLRPLCVLFIVAIILRRNEKSVWWLSIPAIVNAVLAFSAFFSPIMFSYDESNKFERGILGYVPFVVATFYLIIMIVLTVSLYRDGNKYESSLTLVIVVICLSSTLLVSIGGYKGFLNVAIIISVTFYYLYLHTQKYKRDTLTNILDRRCFYLDSQKIQNTDFYVVSIDINNLKTINDTYGHAAGDKAIVTLVDVVKSCVSKNCRLYRTGGDEFMMICQKTDSKSVEKLISSIKQSMSETEYSCAVGYCHFKQGDDFEKVCAVADNAMYEDKREMKSNMKI